MKFVWFGLATAAAIGVSVVIAGAVSLVLRIVDVGDYTRGVWAGIASALTIWSLRDTVFLTLKSSADKGRTE